MPTAIGDSPAQPCPAKLRGPHNMKISRPA